MRQPVGREPLAHLGAAAELGDERLVEPRLVDAQVLVREQPVAIEALDVVALVRRAIAPDIDGVLRHRAHEQRARDGPTEGRRVEVAMTCRLDVERTALQRRDSFVCERLLAVDEHRLFRAVGSRTIGHGCDVRLVVLAKIGGERVGDRAALAHPRERAAGVEAAGEGDAHSLSHRECGEDDVRCARGDGHAAPSSRWRLISSAMSAPVWGSRATRRTVFSPAIVPAMLPWRDTSIACASALA